MTIQILRPTQQVRMIQTHMIRAHMIRARTAAMTWRMTPC